ncbi:MAG: hypothetical protein [Bacteriophage sp.]|jgi:uncharacterized protein YpmS|uniref:Uncharacterized protein n=1 Tax=Myoviridae sp. ctNQV2 TaxID=2827683 RepID=A0A8S5S058_9CAUD|nr:MAG: hypothetical protein [Bacteriophage sp.]DAF44155.1 MAG TPA: hypothetical protein [Myoviridae sp. ctNQV2]UVX33265.1 MAG: hypothetical protein [Bacteriophage sp.]UVY03305.1 MAG: hypothetical protein [Bacteriophage sp.]UWD58161.1 MAG: hypothetical protein [Bacteriophage sp.]
MGVTPKRYKVKLNSVEKVEELLQETYNQACQQIVTIQEEMNKLSQSTILANEITDAKTKYAKAMNDFIANKDKAIGRKLEIAKFMGDILKYNGDIEKSVNENAANTAVGGLNWDEIKKAMQSVENNPTTEEYKLN